MNLFDLIDGIDSTSEENIVDGIRLHKLELYNWGTFDKYIWTFNPNGNTSLLTGESGSGKSTIVDALTTLLVSPRKTAYNKAADATARERTVKSYVLGYYGRKYAFEGKGKPEALREQNNYSVILATFKDMVTDETTTLAMFFWFKDNDGTPSKLYVVSQKELSIAEHFTKFNSNIRTLRDNLKNNEAMIFDNYKHYAQYFRKLMGGVSEQAIELFQQTISMKKVEALNDFVRGSMLEREDVDTQIDDLLKHYHNLNSAYAAVVKAKEQIEKLQPISTKGAEYTEKDRQAAKIDMARQSLELWFATETTDIITEQINIKTDELKEIQRNIKSEEGRISQIREDIMETKGAIKQNGGEEIERLTTELRYKNEELVKRINELYKYNNLVNILKLKPGSSIENYAANLKELKLLSEKYKEAKNNIQARRVETEISIQNCQQDKENIQHEIESLRNRSSNIPRRLIELRKELCSELHVNEELIPFAGELLEVKDSQIKWEGAIERLVHGFAISLLVPEQYYSDVAAWVNKKSIGTKLVYFRTSTKSNPNVFADLNKDTVASKLSVKMDTVFGEWLTNEIQARFPHVCCEGITQFKKEAKAITITGQIKSNIRHEKDDRQSLGDRTRYVLGFSNKKKIQVLKQSLDKHNEELNILESNKKSIIKEQDGIERLIQTISNINQHDDFNKMDVETTKKEVNDFQKRLHQLQSSNSVLETLKDQLDKLKKKENAIDVKISALRKKEGGCETSLSMHKAKQGENQEKILRETETDRTMYPFLSKSFNTFVGEVKLNLANSEQLEKKYNNGLTAKYNRLQNDLSSLRSSIEKSMEKFRDEYPNEAYELWANVQSINEYDDLLKRLLYHNLPKYQLEFKQELQGKIIQHISIFNAMLSQHKKNITTRIREINQSLHSIDYNSGRYITIVCEDTPEADIRAFRNQLKSCTEGMASGVDDDLAATKFLQIKEIIERFKGRLEFTDSDRRWTEKVTDVRNWFIFSASERWRDGDEEYEHYSDSDGKSGGQKEKLAYTILAASLVYNYRLNQVGNNGSSFRLVVIDEAFLKSSDDSAKFGLKLFQQLNFQLLVVTPLLKISTIEPFISHVGFVTHSDLTHTSTLKNIPMEVYKQRRKEWEESSFGSME